MLCYETLRKKPKELLALTGLTRREFEELLLAFEQALPQPTQRKRRRRAPGGGRKPGLATAADKLLFILVYTKTYPLQVVQAQLFGMSQPSANRYIRQLLPVLVDALDQLGVLPTRTGSQIIITVAPSQGAGLHQFACGAPHCMPFQMGPEALEDRLRSMAMTN